MAISPAIGPCAVTTVGWILQPEVRGPASEWSCTTSTSRSARWSAVRQRVDHFGERLAHALERRLAIGLQELRTAVGLPGSYQDDLVAASGEAFDQGVHH